MGEKNRKERNSFAGLGIPVGTTLLFKKRPEVSCVTVDGLNKVKYEGADCAISTLATKLNGYPSNGFDFFYLNGVKLSKLAQAAAKEPAVEASGDGVAPGSDAPPATEPTVSEGVEAEPPEPSDGQAQDIDPLKGASSADEFNI
jgi:hypothetical protein